jgi:uncharacterized phosphosugar-binding protein
MTSSLYLAAARRVLDHLADTQGAAIAAAAELVARAVTAGGTVNCAEIGHGIQGDFINRAGGLVAVQPFTFRIDVHNPVPEVRRRAEEGDRRDADLARVRTAVQHSSLRPGDVMLVSSVSGRNRQPVELTLACRERGLSVIAFTSLAYTAHIQSLHPSGKRLCDVADVVIDIGAPYGDAAVDVPGYEVKLLPVSGLGMLVAGWMIWEEVLKILARQNTPPSVLISHNREGGPAFNEKSRTEYNTRGF